MSATATPDRDELVGRVVGGKYRVRRLIGRGGMGAVYEAEALAGGPPVALKFVGRTYAKDEQVAGRFAREARAASSIASPHIVTVLDGGTEDGLPYIVMELLAGEDLGTRLRREGKLAIGESVHVTAQVLKGLARAHAAGIVHRDLKPDNVLLVARDGDPAYAKIVDFGVSKIRPASGATVPLALTGKGTALGTPLYMAPEQAQAAPDLDGRADIFSVGAILFECITGRPPHTGSTYEQIILSICMSDAPDIRAIEPRVPAPLAALVARALARNRDKRFQSAEEMLAALHDAFPEERARVPPDPPRAASRPSFPRAPSRPSVPGARPGAPPSRVRRAVVPVVAFVGTLVGVLVTLWIVTSLRAAQPANAPAPVRSDAAAE